LSPRYEVIERHVRTRPTVLQLQEVQVVAKMAASKPPARFAANIVGVKHPLLLLDWAKERNDGNIGKPGANILRTTQQDAIGIPKEKERIRGFLVLPPGYRPNGREGRALVEPDRELCLSLPELMPQVLRDEVH